VARRCVDLDPECRVAHKKVPTPKYIQHHGMHAWEAYMCGKWPVLCSGECKHLFHTRPLGVIH